MDGSDGLKGEIGEDGYVGLPGVQGVFCNLISISHEYSVIVYSVINRLDYFFKFT